MSSAPRRRSSPLTVDTVVEAARALVAEDGLDQLSMRSLGSRLGVSPMAVYRHVADRDELVARTLDAALARLDIPPPLDPEPSAEAISDWLTAATESLRQVFTDHPGIASRLLLTGPAGPNGLALMHQACVTLALTGRRPAEVAAAYDWLLTTVTTYAAKRDAMAGTAPQVAASLAQEAMAYADRLPGLLDVLAHITGDVDEAARRATGSVIAAVSRPAS